MLCVDVYAVVADLDRVGVELDVSEVVCKLAGLDVVVPKVQGALYNVAVQLAGGQRAVLVHADIINGVVSVLIEDGNLFAVHLKGAALAKGYGALLCYLLPCQRACMGDGDIKPLVWGGGDRKVRTCP